MTAAAVGVNPIRKRRSRRCGNHDFACASASYWYAVCPECGKAVRPNQYSRSTRKTAKDALHKHLRREHS